MPCGRFSGIFYPALNSRLVAVAEMYSSTSERTSDERAGTTEKDRVARSDRFHQAHRRSEHPRSGRARRTRRARRYRQRRRLRRNANDGSSDRQRRRRHRFSSSGEILTNNHVIAGATTIRVVVPNTTHTYTARVVGYDTTADVAVLQLRNASNLKTVRIGDASKLAIGAHVTAVGNAGGTGTLTSANGTVTGVNKSITVQNDSRAAERLSGLIETNAALQPGDSGGPLLNSAGRVVGMDTAASSSFPFAVYRSSDGYAIPIAKALMISREIVSGKSSATVHVGGTAFLGVQVADGPSVGATVVGVVTGAPADRAGLAPGDVITAVGRKTVTSATGLEPIILASKPGTKVTIAYTDTAGQSQTATVTLGSGPPQ
ncbi:MAG: PDZ domain-containing protein [Actinobacteria bacterium]|nr:MAG: PDZ domain-containing protein [Actinomycetota bacterium]